MELKCPKCGGGDVRRLSLVWEEGTAIVEGHSHVAGIGLKDGDPVLAAGSGRTATQHQTLLASRSAPPQQRPIGCAVAAIVGGAVIAWLGIFGENLNVAARFLLPTAGLGSLGLGVGMYWQAVNFNLKRLPKLQEQWEKSFRCLRCGQVFAPAMHEST